MAQAFEIPMGNRTAHHCTLVSAQDDHHNVPSNAFQIAAPGPIQRRIGFWNMGPVSDHRKRSNAALPRPLTDPNPGPAILARLIVSVGFDKGGPLPVSLSLRIAGAFSRRFPDPWALIRFWGNQFASC
jgi:hypothetical protein